MSTPNSSDPSLKRGLIMLLAVGAGLAVASLYYSQPMLGVLGAELGAAPGALGWIPTLTQLGYAFGILLLAPLGDRYDRKRIILAKSIVLAAGLLLAGFAPGMSLMLAASFTVGVAATMAQDIVPAAATLAPAERRGAIVGTVMTGLLLGILLSRVVGGFVAENLGWRVMFWVAALAILVLALALWRHLPGFAPTSRLPYRALLGSLGTLWRLHSELRRSAIAQGLLYMGFSAFWSTLAVMLHDAPFHLGADAAGAFGLAGAAGALAAPLVGRVADRHGPARLARLGAALTAVSFASMALLPALPPSAALWLIAASAVGFDLGIQMSLIAHQSIVYGIDPAARSRLNAVLMTGVFVGMAAGGALGGMALAHWGWIGVTALATATAAGALALRALPRRPAPVTQCEA
ncbi:MFS transporter [Achromobacter sp. RTa]|uniref:MFS transporter n=1 Tax=Achromobacter sp. RTa TaxID=1532557 RepID=UPI00050FF600|nr:MFS transporter [Achromobacter sp. RTa]KGD90102.1 MFS transporter [Achromobacter sp. RTa]